MQRRILILSEEEDALVEDVMAWCLRRGAQVLRLHENRRMHFISADIREGGSDICFEVEGERYSLGTFHSVWYRRGEACIRSPLPPVVPDSVPEEVQLLIREEARVLRRDLLWLMEHVHPRFLGSITGAMPSKLAVLHMAQSCGLSIPDTCISARRDILHRFGHREGGAITKLLSNPAGLQWGDAVYQHLTREYTGEVHPEGPDYAIPVCVQARVPRACELRVCVVGRVIVAVALMPDSAAAVVPDMRPSGLAVRKVPFVLRTEESDAILRLMDRLGLHIGALDFMVDPSGDLHFLELNPEGQMGYYTEGLSPDFERSIADYLLEDYA